MKKILFIAILLATLSSCETQTVKKRDLPIEIVSIKESQKFDTILTIETEKKVFMFSKEREYKGTYDKIQEDKFPIGLIVGILLILLLVVIFMT